MVELQSYRICKLAYSFYGKCTKSILYILEVFRAGVPNSERNALIRNALKHHKTYKIHFYEAIIVKQNTFKNLLKHFWSISRSFIFIFVSISGVPNQGTPFRIRHPHPTTTYMCSTEWQWFIGSVKVKRVTCSLFSSGGLSPKV